jgi:hypothetical protein
MGRTYYLTTLGAWRRHHHRFTHSHYICLDAAADGPAVNAVRTPPLVIRADQFANADDSTQILVLVEADEGAHNALEQDIEWEPLPHPLSQKPVSINVQHALVGQGIAQGATTFDVTESLGRTHPLLRHRVF